MTTRQLLFASAIAVTLLSFGAPARAESIPLDPWQQLPLRPGDVIRAEFDVRWLGSDTYGPSNVLLFAPGVAEVEPIGSFTTRLYDGERLLGTYTGMPGAHTGAGPRFGSWFKAPGAVFTLGNPTIIDFTSFQNGTFNGRVEFQIGSGLARIYRVSDELDLDVAISPGVASGAGFAPRTFEIVVPDPVPEPGTLLLLGSGLAVLGIGCRRHARRP